MLAWCQARYSWSEQSPSNHRLSVVGESVVIETRVQAMYYQVRWSKAADEVEKPWVRLNRARRNHNTNDGIQIVKNRL